MERMSAGNFTWDQFLHSCRGVSIVSETGDRGEELRLGGAHGINLRGALHQNCQPLRGVEKF